MAEAPESIAPKMSSHFANLGSMYDPNVCELVWENDQILFRNLTSNMTGKKTGFPCSESKDRVSDSGMIKLDRHDTNNINSYPNRMQTGYPEMYPELYEDDDFNVVSQNYHREQIVPVNKKVERTLSDSEVPQSCEAKTAPFINRSKERSSGIDDEKRNRVNFSVFLRSPSLIKTIYPSSEAARPTRNINRSMEKEVNATVSHTNALLPNSEPRKGLVHVPDQQSEAVGHKDTLGNCTRFADNGVFGEQVVPISSSLSSRGDSNCPSYTLERRYEDNDSSEINGTEESEEASAARGRKRVKGKRKAADHNLYERRRRDKINKKMRALKELIPNCNKVDKASMLDDAIEYLRTLQLQVQMMSMANLNPMIVSSAMAMQQLYNAQQLGCGYFPFAFGFGVQFPMPRFNMVGYPTGQGLSMSMSRPPAPAPAPAPPVVSLGAERFSPPQSIHASAAALVAAAAGVEIPGGGAYCVRLSTSRDSNPTND